MMPKRRIDNGSSSSTNKQKKKKSTLRNFQYDSNECIIPKAKVINVIIDESVTIINLQGCRKLKSVTLPQSLTSITEGAFENCQSLTSIDIPDSVSSIGEGAFGYCYGLTKVSIPEGITALEKNVFHYCKSLTGITLPESLTELGNYCLSLCLDLKMVRIPASVTKIGEGVFSDCGGMKYVQFQDDMTLRCLGDYAFCRCQSLMEIKIPKSVQKIGKYNFHENIFLTSIVIPDGVPLIDEGTFSTCSNLSSVTIPHSVTQIKESAFKNCRSLVFIHIPQSVTKIERNAFKECYCLQLIVLPKNVQISEPETIFEECREFDNWKDTREESDNDNGDNFVNFVTKRFDKLPIHRACYYLNTDDDIKSGPMLPEVFTQQLKELINNNKDSLSLKDEMGLTPLHVLCCNPRATPEMIKLLMNAQPDAAMVRNVSKMSPLDMYLISKHAISSYDYEDIREGFYDEDYDFGDNYVKGIIAASWRKKPRYKVLDILKTGLSYDVMEVIFALYDGMNVLEELENKDTKTGLYPFMVAASNPKCELDVVYMILMACPHALPKIE